MSLQLASKMTAIWKPSGCLNREPTRQMLILCVLSPKAMWVWSVHTESKPAEPSSYLDCPPLPESPPQKQQLTQIGKATTRTGANVTTESNLAKHQSDPEHHTHEGGSVMLPCRPRWQ